MRWLLALATTGLCLLGIELALRTLDPPPEGAPRLADFRTWVPQRTAPEGAYLLDPELGWVTRPGLEFVMDGVHHAVDAAGRRVNGNPPVRRPDALVLAVGDSYTFGHRLDDEATWPSALERKTGVRVVNAGVSGYGLDQMWILTQRALDDLPKPRTVIVAVISDDIDRMRYGVRAGIAKPHFELDARGDLVLVPADHAAVAAGGGGLCRSVLGHSWAVHRIARRIAPGHWNRGTFHDFRRVDLDVGAVGRAIVDAFASEVAGVRGIELVFVLLPASPEDLAMATPSPDGAARAVARRMAEVARRDPRVFVVDLQSEIARRIPDEAARRALYHDPAFDPSGHFDADGAELVASILASVVGPDGGVVPAAVVPYAPR